MWSPVYLAKGPVGHYDDIPELGFGLMYHGLTYPDESYSKETRGKNDRQLLVSCHEAGRHCFSAAGSTARFTSRCGRWK